MHPLYCRSWSDVTQISRYERGGESKKMPKTFKRDLLRLVTEPEIEYIAKGKNTTGSIGSVSDSGQRPQEYDKSIQTVVDLLHKMNDEQRMKVFMHAAKVFAGKG